jgi:hypothetical protein
MGLTAFNRRRRLEAERLAKSNETEPALVEVDEPEVDEPEVDEPDRPTSNFSGFKVSELKTMLLEADVQFNPNLKKSDLVKLAEEHLK